MDEISFQEAIELLEVADFSKIEKGDVINIAKKAKKRWHPDKVAHLNNVSETEKYTRNFQLIDRASEVLLSFMEGNYRAGEKINEQKKQTYQEPEEIIRQNASNIQGTLKDLFAIIIEKKYKWSFKDIVISKGFKLKEILNNDFKEDLAMLSIVSLFYGSALIGILMLVCNFLAPGLVTVLGIIWIIELIASALGFLPLSRFWLPELIQNAMIKIINAGLMIYNWAEEESTIASWWVKVLVALPNLFALAIKYLILFPLYEIAKIILKDKVIGVVNDRVNYYAGTAQWYIEDLINMQPVQMTKEQLFDLSYLYSELSDVKSKL